MPGHKTDRNPEGRAPFSDSCLWRDTLVHSMEKKKHLSEGAWKDISWGFYYLLLLVRYLYTLNTHTHNTEFRDFILMAAE